MTAQITLDILRAAAVLMLARIGVSDFLTQKIHNEHVLQLFAVAIAILLITLLTDRDITSAGLTLTMTAGLFVVLVIFWLLGKVGAGDVKLLSIMPILVGFSASLPFVCVLLAFTLVTYFIMKFPLVLPARWFRTYVASLAKSGQVPFGVPIAAAAIVVVLLPANMLSLTPPPRPSQFIQQLCAPLSLGDELSATTRNGLC
jgi:prepilin peptidase CpaA